MLCVLAYLYLKTYYVIIDKNEEIIIEHKVGITKMMKLSDISSISSSKDNGAIYLIIRSNNKMRIKINIYSTSWHTKEMIDYLKRKGILSYKFKV